jgi:hypothetical protein
MLEQSVDFYCIICAWLGIQRHDLTFPLNPFWYTVQAACFTIVINLPEDYKYEEHGEAPPTHAPKTSQKLVRSSDRCFCIFILLFNTLIIPSFLPVYIHMCIIIDVGMWLFSETAYKFFDMIYDQYMCWDWQTYLFKGVLSSTPQVSVVKGIYRFKAQAFL